MLTCDIHSTEPLDYASGSRVLDNLW